MVSRPKSDVASTITTCFGWRGKAINEKVRLYARVGQALIEAKGAGGDPFEAIERVVSWEQFIQSVQEAEKLARPEDFDYLGLLSNHYAQLRRYTPAFLEDFTSKPLRRPRRF